MRIFVVDDESLAMQHIKEMTHKCCPEAEVLAFQDGVAALKEAEQAAPDIGLLDIEMSRMTGLDLARKLKKLNPYVNLIFITDHQKYMQDAFRIHASGYLLKPVTLDNLRNELRNLLFPLPEKEPRVHVDTFGVFSVRLNGQTPLFQYRKTEELLAYLVAAAGRFCTIGELVDVLWEDGVRRHESYLRNLISDMRHAFREYDCEDIILRRKGKIALDISQINCDFYDWIHGDKLARETFDGKFMTQYSWAETTLAWMLKIQQGGQ